MTSDPKDAERLATVLARQLAGHFAARSMPTWETIHAAARELREVAALHAEIARITQERDDLRDSYNELYAGAERLKQERDEARRSAEAMTVGWRPIESAPKTTSDGSSIELLLWSPASSGGWWDIGEWDDGLGWVDQDACGLPNVTHWQLLPSPPTTSDGGETSATQPSADDVPFSEALAKASDQPVTDGLRKVYRAYLDNQRASADDVERAREIVEAFPSYAFDRQHAEVLAKEVAAALTAARCKERQLRALDEAED